MQQADAAQKLLQGVLPRGGFSVRFVNYNWLEYPLPWWVFRRRVTQGKTGEIIRSGGCATFTDAED